MNKRRVYMATATAVITVAVAVVCSLAFGTRSVNVDEIFQGLRHFFNGDTHETIDNLGALAVYQRIPRTVVALSVGAALGMSGALMQSVTRNPIADPGILGINAGAALAVAVTITLFHLRDTVTLLIVAILGAFVTGLFVYLLGSLGPGGATPVKLALAGVATSAVLGAITIALRLPLSQERDEFIVWVVGSVARGNWHNLASLTPILVAAFVASILIARNLNALALGDQTAVSLGISLARTRLVASSAAVALCGASTALVGPIGFVGLMIPHIVRALVSVDMRVLIPLSAFGGAALLTISDVIGRLIASPSELSVGVVTAFIGAPILIMTVRSSKVHEL